jgi:hypothetical protein
MVQQPALRPRGQLAACLRQGRLAMPLTPARSRSGPQLGRDAPPPWAQRTVNKRTEAPRLGLGSTAEFPRLPYIGAHVLRRVAGRAGVPAHVLERGDAGTQCPF